MAHVAPKIEPLSFEVPGDRYLVTFDELLNVDIKPLTDRTKNRLERFGPPKYLKEFVISRRQFLGYVYLIHFDVPYKHAKHYMGFTKNIDVRMDQHIARNGANLMRVIEEAGITWHISRIWVGDRFFERKLKKQKMAPKLCPTCRESSGKAASGERSPESYSYRVRRKPPVLGSSSYSIPWPYDD